MTVSRMRLGRLEKIYGADGDEPGRLVLICPNAWPDADRDAYYAGADEPIGRSAVPIPDVARLGGLSEGALDAIGRQTGVRPISRRGHICVMAVPAPQEIEDADEATRAAWRANYERPAWSR